MNMNLLVVASEDSLKNLEKKDGINIIPFTSIRFKQLVKKYEIEENYDWILFTSKQGVKSFFKACDKAKLEKKKIAAIGEKTKEYLDKFGVNVDFIPTKYSSEEFVKEFPQKNKVLKGIFYPASELADNFIKNKFENENIKLVRKNFYTTECVNDFEIPEFDGIVFSSPSGAKCFFKKFDKSNLHNKLVVSIGTKTQKYLEQLEIKSEIPEKFTLNSAIDFCCKK